MKIQVKIKQRASKQNKGLKPKTYTLAYLKRHGPCDCAGAGRG